MEKGRKGFHIFLRVSYLNWTICTANTLGVFVRAKILVDQLRNTPKLPPLLVTVIGISFHRVSSFCSVLPCSVICALDQAFC